MTEADLLAAVLAEPDDDAPRLILADWWAENGQDERAEFVRVQVALANLNAELLSEEDCEDSRCPGCEERRRLLERERELLEKRGRQWRSDAGLYCEREMDTTRLEDVPQRFMDLWASETWCRGFVEKLNCKAADWLAHANTITTKHPIREVTLTTWPSVQLTITQGMWPTPEVTVLRIGARNWHPDPGGTDAERTLAVLAAYWPRINFALPQGSLWVATPEDVRRMIAKLD